MAAQQGLEPDQVANQIEALVGGSIATNIRFGEQLVAVRVRGAENLRSRASQMADLPLTAPGGHGVRLGSIAHIGIDGGQKQFTREDLAPFLAVTARLEGRDLGSAMQAVRAKVAGLHLPGSVRVDYGGLYAEQQKSFTDMAMATVLLTASAVLLGLWMTGTELNISALMGLTMVVGMVTELVIFYLAEIEGGASATLAALREAGSKRLRPILMSALIAILTLSPLALGLSRGAGLQQPLATAIIFGLVAAVPLVLLFLPALLLCLPSRSKA